MAQSSFRGKTKKRSRRKLMVEAAAIEKTFATLLPVNGERPVFATSQCAASQSKKAAHCRIE